MMHQVYKLNLPDIDNIGFNKKVKSDLRLYNYAILYDLPNLISEKYINLKGIHWDHILYWKKYNYVGNIHRDVNPNNFNKKMLHGWGISWTWGGDTLIQYWNIEDCEFTEFSPSSCNNSTTGSVPYYKTNKKPFATYELLSNQCYLVNGHLPHRAIGVGERESIRLCPALYVQISWESRIKLFSDIILDWSTQEKKYNVDNVIEKLNNLESFSQDTFY